MRSWGKGWGYVIKTKGKKIYCKGKRIGGGGKSVYAVEKKHGVIKLHESTIGNESSRVLRC